MNMLQECRQLQPQSGKAEASRFAVKAGLNQEPQQAGTAAAVRGVIGQTSQHAQSTGIAAVVGQGGVLAPRSRADEEHHLALALSASMGEPLAGGC